MGLKAENYNIGDLEKYFKFRQANQELGTLDAARIYNIKREEDNKKFVENFSKYLNNLKRRVKIWNFGEHFTIYLNFREFGFGLKYSHDNSEQDANLLYSEIAFFTFELRF